MLTALALSMAFATVTGTVTDGKKPVREAVVWIHAGTATPTKASIVQKDKAFTPRILVVPSGSSVDFPNRDDIFHNVFAEYNAKKFDLGMYPKGQTRSVTFDKPGIVSVLCNMHGSMSAFVIVVPCNSFAKTDKNGKFKIEGVTPGKYVVEAWHESNLTFKDTLNVGETPITITISRK